MPLSSFDLTAFLTSPLGHFWGVELLLKHGLIVLVVFLFIARLLPEFAQKLVILLGSIAFIECITSPFYTFLFIFYVGGVYYAIFWLQWNEKKRIYCPLIACITVIFYFLLLTHPWLKTAYTGSLIHQFGISYSLFRLVSVILDVGWGKPLPVDPMDFFIYAFFAPTFFQGPIEQLDEFRSNFDSKVIEKPFNLSEIGSALIRMGVGLVKGWIAVYFFERDWVTFFNYPQNLSYLDLVWGFYQRSIGFYLVASACNDLTIGGCWVAGIRLSENFNYPYFARNLAEFWRRWHMTLGRFARDYIYIPLGGNKRHVALNYLVVFLFIALWHVVSPAFLIWGLWHGLGMVGLHYWKVFCARTELLKQWASRYPLATRVASTIFTFHFVAIGWLPFEGGHPQGVSLFLRLISGNHWKLFVW